MGISKQARSGTKESAPSPASAHVKHLTSSAGAPSNTKLLTNSVNSSVPDESTAQAKVDDEEIEVAQPQQTESDNKPWTARGWTARQYVDLVEQTFLSFPIEEFMRKHNKTELQVREVFMGVVRLPLLAQVSRRPGAPRGGVGEQRMHEFRRMEKVARQACREEAEGKGKHKVGEEGSVDMGKLPVVKPTTRAEAAANMEAALKEYNKAVKIHERLAAKEVAKALTPKKRATKSNAEASK